MKPHQYRLVQDFVDSQYVAVSSASLIQAGSGRPRASQHLSDLDRKLPPSCLCHLVLILQGLTEWLFQPEMGPKIVRCGSRIGTQSGLLVNGTKD